MPTRYIKVDIDEDRLEQINDGTITVDDYINSKLPEGVSLQDSRNGIVDLLEHTVAQVPNIEDALNSVARFKGDTVRVPLDDIMDCCAYATEAPLHVLMMLAKARQGVTSLAHDLEHQYDQEMDEFREWKASVRTIISQDNDSNPLVNKGIKIAKYTQKAYIRNQDKYIEYKTRLNKYKNYKEKMWATKGVIDLMHKIVSAYIQDPDQMSDVAKRVRDAKDLKTLAEKVAQES